MSKLANLSALLADPEFQQQIQTQIRREAAAHNSYITYRDEQDRHVVEYPGSGQLYEQTEDRQLVLLSIGGQAVAPAAPISWAEAKQRQAPKEGGLVRQSITPGAAVGKAQTRTDSKSGDINCLNACN